MTVLTQECTSVNHQVAQARSLNGNGINSGRTLMEAMAIRHGEDLILPNCNMAVDGFIQPGWDASIPSFARAEIVSAPMGFAAAMDGMKGVLGLPERELVQHARGVQDRLDDASPFGKTFVDSPMRRSFLEDRRERLPRLEEAQLVDPLTMLPAEMLDPKYGITSSPLLPTLLGRLPDMHANSWQAQAALSVLLSYYGLSCATTISLQQEPVFSDGELATAPVAFDFAHVDHRLAQQLMWGALLEVADALIDGLRPGEDTPGGRPVLGHGARVEQRVAADVTAAAGESGLRWDRSRNVHHVRLRRHDGRSRPDAPLRRRPHLLRRRARTGHRLRRKTRHVRDPRVTQHGHASIRLTTFSRPRAFGRPFKILHGTAAFLAA
jgi:hypothetical protein